MTVDRHLDQFSLSAGDPESFPPFEQGGRLTVHTPAARPLLIFWLIQVDFPDPPVAGPEINVRTVPQYGSNPGKRRYAPLYGLLIAAVVDQGKAGVRVEACALQPD